MPGHVAVTNARRADRGRLAAAILLTLGAASAFGADSISPPGLPAGFDWTFNFDATVGAFGFANSLYTNPKPDEPSGDLSDDWLEASIKPALGAVYKMGNASEFYGKVSASGERTFGAAPSIVGEDASSFDVDDLYIGWRSGTSLANGENVLDFTLGRSPYKLGHGLLLYDGTSEGGTRGGYWTNARKAFEFAAIGRLQARQSHARGVLSRQRRASRVRVGQQALGCELRVRVR